MPGYAPVSKNKVEIAIYDEVRNILNDDSRCPEIRDGALHYGDFCIMYSTSHLGVILTISTSSGIIKSVLLNEVTWSDYDIVEKINNKVRELQQDQENLKSEIVLDVLLGRNRA